jgi:hypothetical protein
VLPELDLVVLFTAANYGNFRVWRHFRDEMLPQYIIAAVRSRPEGRHAGKDPRPQDDRRFR